MNPQTGKVEPSREAAQAETDKRRDLETWDDEGGAGRQGARKESEPTPAKPRVPKQ